MPSRRDYPGRRRQRQGVAHRRGTRGRQSGDRPAKRRDKPSPVPTAGDVPIKRKGLRTEQRRGMPGLKKYGCRCEAASECVQTSEASSTWKQCSCCKTKCSTASLRRCGCERRSQNKCCERLVQPLGYAAAVWLRTPRTVLLQSKCRTSAENWWITPCSGGADAAQAAGLAIRVAEETPGRSGNVARTMPQPV